MHYLAATGLVTCIVAGMFIYRRLVGRDFADRLVLAVVPLLLLAVAFRLFVAIAARPYNAWDTVRLTPVFAFWHGYPLYPTPDTGPLLSFCYGPVSALAYLPLVLSPSPTFAVLAGATMTALMLLGPVLWIHLDRPSSADQFMNGVIGFLAFTGIALLLPSLTYSLFSPAHDAVALSLGAMSAAVLGRRGAGSGAASLIVSALLAILSVSAKQNMICILLALPLYLLMTEGVRDSMRYIWFLGLFGLGVSLTFLTTFDRDGLILNMLEIPAHHVRDKSLADSIRSLQYELPMVAIPLILALLYCRSERLFLNSTTDHDVKPWRGWLPFLILGASQIPLVLIAYSKLGGAPNSFSFSLYFLLIGSTLLLSRFGDRSASSVDQRALHHRRVGQLVLLALSSVLILAPVLPITSSESLKYPDPLKTSFEFEKKYPGRAYFPWNTLSVVMAGGKVYHAEDGIISLAMGGMDLSIEQFHTYLPPGATLLALPPNYPAEWTGRRIQRVLPEFRQKISVDELPGWSVYEREVTSVESTNFNFRRKNTQSETTSGAGEN
jgi:hypothetical protein